MQEKIIQGSRYAVTKHTGKTFYQRLNSYSADNTMPFEALPQDVQIWFLNNPDVFVAVTITSTH